MGNLGESYGNKQNWSLAAWVPTRNNTEPQTGWEYQERMKTQSPHRIDLALRQEQKQSVCCKRLDLACAYCRLPVQKTLNCSIYLQPSKDLT